MFFKESLFTRLLKNAYKSGVSLATLNGWIHIDAGYWQVDMRIEDIPKTIMGTIISVVGRIPEEGQRVLASKDGDQIEIGMELEIDRSGYLEELVVTSVVITEKDSSLRVMQDPYTFNVYTINDVYLALIDLSAIDQTKGEYLPGAPRRKGDLGYGSVLIENNFCRLKVYMRMPEQRKPLLVMTGKDLMPEFEDEEKEEAQSIDHA